MLNDVERDVVIVVGGNFYNL